MALIEIIRFKMMQYKFFRKYVLKGKFYHLCPRWLSMGSFWSDKIITSCGTIILKTEEYGR